MISAKVIQHSSFLDTELITFEIECHRFIWSEFMTHKGFSRNAASSRAIPVQQTIDRVLANPAAPIHWGKNQPGMQAKEELSDTSLSDQVVSAYLFDPSYVSAEREALIRRGLGSDKKLAQQVWKEAADSAAFYAQTLANMGVHKQIVNRILEPFTYIKAVVTMDHLAFRAACKLRRHEDAQPEIHALFDAMFEAYDNSTPIILRLGEWHIPYKECDLSLEDQIKVGVSCAAQVSYRKNDTSLEKAHRIYDMLVNQDIKHASPFEHVAQAKPGKFANFHNFENLRTQLGW